MNIKSELCENSRLVRDLIIPHYKNHEIIDMTPGVTPEGVAYDGKQIGMLMNHLAFVPRGRMNHNIGDEKETTMTTTVMIDGVAVKVAEGADALSKALADHEAVKANLADAEAAKTAADADWQQKVKDLEAQIAQIKKENMTADQMDAAIEARAALLADAAKIAPSFDAKGKNDAEIRKGVVAAVAGDDAVTDKSADYITARFDALVDAGPSDPFAAPIKKSANDGTIPLKDVFAAAGVPMKG